MPLKILFKIRQPHPNLAQADAMKVTRKLGKYFGFYLKPMESSMLPFIVPQSNKKTSSVLGAFSDLRKQRKFLSKLKQQTDSDDRSLLEPTMVEDICAGLTADSLLRGTEFSW